MNRCESKWMRSYIGNTKTRTLHSTLNVGDIDTLDARLDEVKNMVAEHGKTLQELIGDSAHDDVESSTGMEFQPIYLDNLSVFRKHE